MDDSAPLDKPDSAGVGYGLTMPEVGRLAASLLWRDRHIAGFLYLLLIVPALLQEFVLPPDPNILFAIMFVDRLIELGTLGIIAWRAAGALRTPVNSKALADTYRVIVPIGLLIWLPIALPLTGHPWFFQVGSFAWMLVLAGGVFLGTRYFFYFIGPVVLPIGQPLRRHIGLAHTISQLQFLLPWIVVLGPFSIMMGLSGLMMSPAPDGRSATLTFLALCFGGVYWILSSYIGIAVGANVIRDGLTGPLPYWHDRLRTLAAQAPKTLATVLDPMLGMKLLYFSIVIFFTNQSIAYFSGPPGKIHDTSVAVGERSMMVSLELVDDTHHFRALNPGDFVLAGEQGTRVSTAVESALVDGRQLDLKLPFETDERAITLALQFTLDRSGEELKMLGDLYLWYRGVKLVHLSPLLGPKTPKSPPSPSDDLQDA